MSKKQQQRQPFVPKYIEWEPPQAMWAALKEKGLKTRDRIEIICVFFSYAHLGAYAYASEVASILQISKQVVQENFERLIEEGRAVKIDGRFCLIGGSYTHPVLCKYINKTQASNVEDST